MNALANSQRRRLRIPERGYPAGHPPSASPAIRGRRRRTKEHSDQPTRQPPTNLLCGADLHAERRSPELGPPRRQRLRFPLVLTVAHISRRPGSGHRTSHSPAWSGFCVRNHEHHLASALATWRVAGPSKSRRYRRTRRSALFRSYVSIRRRSSPNGCDALRNGPEADATERRRSWVLGGSAVASRGNAAGRVTPPSRHVPLSSWIESTFRRSAPKASRNDSCAKTPRRLSWARKAHPLSCRN